MGTKVSGADPMLSLGTRMCRCCACDKYFNSPAAFDAHREGNRCLDTRAMRKRGMAVNARGYWVEKGWDDARLSE